MCIQGEEKSSPCLFISYSFLNSNERKEAGKNEGDIVVPLTHLAQL